MLPVIVSLTPNMCLANMLLTSSAMNNILMMLCSVPCVEQSVVAFDWSPGEYSVTYLHPHKGCLTMIHFNLERGSSRQYLVNCNGRYLASNVISSLRLLQNQS